MNNQKKIIFKAIDINNQINVNNKTAYQTIKTTNTIYFLVDKQNLDLCRIDWNLKKTLSVFKDNEYLIEADLNSFINIFINDYTLNQIYDLLNVLTIAFCFYHKVVFSLKQNVTDNYNLKLIVDQKYEKIINEAKVISDALFFCRYLQEIPSNILNPITFVQKVTDLFSDVKDKIKITVLDKAAIKAENMNVLLAVNAGSNIEPRVLVIEYLNNPDSKQKYGYVGKGITFDAGGNSIKVENRMRGMKMDMSGAATLMCAIYALAKNNIKTNVVGVTPLTENLISPNALRPDDIITSHAGLTVEVDNTDAEGRLVLADGLSYVANKHQVTKIFNIATLTTEMLFSLGELYSGVWATDNKDWELVLDAANKSGEYVWRMPFHEFYREQINCELADIITLNSAYGIYNGGPAAVLTPAGSCVAAEFIKSFTHNLPFIHFDVAKTSKVNGHGVGALLKTLYQIAKTQN